MSDPCRRTAKWLILFAIASAIIGPAIAFRPTAPAPVERVVRVAYIASFLKQEATVAAVIAEVVEPTSEPMPEPTPVPTAEPVYAAPTLVDTGWHYRAVYNPANEALM